MAAIRRGARSAGEPVRWWLTWERDGVQQRRPLDHALRIGRDSGCDVVLADPTVSRQHAVVSVVAGQPFVDASGSRNGIRIGRAHADRTDLSAGQVFSVGDTDFRVVARAKAAGDPLRLPVHREPQFQRSARARRSTAARLPLLAFGAIAAVLVAMIAATAAFSGAANPPTTDMPVGSAAGGTFSVPGGLTLVVPTGALPQDARLRVAPMTVSPATVSAAWPAEPIGPGYHIELGGGTFRAPVSLSLPYDPAVLPANADPRLLFVAFHDAATDTWQPVGGVVDTGKHTITVLTRHLSDWQLYGVDPSFVDGSDPTKSAEFYAFAFTAAANSQAADQQPWAAWTPILKRVAEGNILDLIRTVQAVTGQCDQAGGGYSIDSSGARGAIQGCVKNPGGSSTTGPTAQIDVTNLRAYALSMTDPADGQRLLESGDTASVPLDARMAGPVVIGADMTPGSLAVSIAEILLRLVPGSDVARSTPAYQRLAFAIANDEATAWDTASFAASLRQNDDPKAVEDLLGLVTGQRSTQLFADAVVAAQIPAFAGVTTASISRIFQVVDLTDLIVTSWSWSFQYFQGTHAELLVSIPPVSVAPPSPQTTPPSPPGNFIVTVASGNSFGVAWSASSGATSYSVNAYAATTCGAAGCGRLVKSYRYSAAATSYQIADLAPASYCFTAVAHGAGATPLPRSRCARQPPRHSISPPIPRPSLRFPQATSSSACCWRPCNRVSFRRA